MTFAKTFGQRHVLHFLDSHVDLFGCRITAASPVGLRVTDGVHQLCLKSTDGCIQREDAPNSVAPELIEVYGSTARRTAMTKRGELSRMPRRLTLQQTVELPESLLRHFLSHPLLSDVDVRRLVDFMYIKVVNPRLQADVVPGDVVQAGVIISNSETGLGSVTIQPLIYRLVCSNGMVINDAKTRRNHVGRAATSDEDFSIYSNETLLADDHAFVLKLKDTVRAAISEARFAQAVNRMRESTTAMLDTKKLPAIVKLASSSFGITEDESNGVLEHLITGGDFSLYGLANAVTRFSQDVESYDRATKLEEIGYSVMTMSPALFRQMNQTELLAA